MITKPGIHICLTALLACTILACSSGKKITKTPNNKTKSTRDFSAMREDFKPADLNDDDIELQETSVVRTNIDDILNNKNAASVDSVGSGYRIQIIQTTDLEEAREVQKEAILRFNFEIYRVFDPPFYKVRVGDFVNWNDAEKVQKLAIQKGFREAWVIRTNINPRKAYSAIDEW